jgi:hypothetical protein
LTRTGDPAAALLDASEQGKLPAAKAFTLAERDKHMSEQKTNFMGALDDWTQEAIIEPLMKDLGGVVGVEMNLQIRRAIRQKVLESYKNGLKAGAVKATSQPARKEQRYAQAKTR